MDELATCLAAQIEADGSPPTCFVGVVPGEAAVMDYGGDCNDKCGIAWVRLASAYPANAVGVQALTPGNCASDLGAEIEIGITRCMEVPGDGQPPEDSEVLATAHQQTKDMLTIFRTVACCSALSS